MAIMHRLKTVHITLEMSEGRVAQRYFQTLYSIAKRPEVSKVSKFKKDDFGVLTDFLQTDLTPRYSLQDPDIRQNLEKLINKWAIRQLNNIYIKEFPTSSLTLHQLEGYLDNLAATKKFYPDLLILDYPDLMKLDRNDLRLSLDDLVKKLRGLAVERNLALATVSQSNRAGAKAKLLDADAIAEAYSKTQHADVTITLSMTAAEKRLGLARLFVAAGRNDQDGFTLVISQHYQTGTFILDSAMMPSDYWNHFEGDDETN
jgi:replicative DNA helicase